VFTLGGITYVYVKHSNLILLAVTRRNANVTVILLFLQRLINVFESYFGELHEESIRDNFVTVYELFDEMMDFGYPQATEPKILKEFIMQEGYKSNSKSSEPTVPTTLTNAVSWRQEGIVHRKNEIFLDVIERLNLLVSSTGTVLHSEILGAVKMKSFLSGMPELKLGLNDRLMFEATGRRSMVSKGKAVEMDDVKFHQCVRLVRTIYVFGVVVIHTHTHTHTQQHRHDLRTTVRSRSFHQMESLNSCPIV